MSKSRDTPGFSVKKEFSRYKFKRSPCPLNCEF
jgi:hypothetical protein